MKLARLFFLPALLGFAAFANVEARAGADLAVSAETARVLLPDEMAYDYLSTFPRCGFRVRNLSATASGEVTVVVSGTAVFPIQGVETGGTITTGSPNGKTFITFPSIPGGGTRSIVASFYLSGVADGDSGAIRCEVRADGDPVSADNVAETRVDFRLPTATLIDGSVSEGAGLRSRGYVYVRLSRPIAESIDFRYRTQAGGTATKDADYEEAPDNFVTLDGGRTTVAVPVKIINDNRAEGDETIDVYFRPNPAVRFTSRLAHLTVLANDTEQPDASITAVNGPTVGANIINATGADQYVNASGTNGSVQWYTLNVRNGGQNTDTIRVHLGNGTNANYITTVLDGNADVTARARSKAGYVLYSIAAGMSRTLTVGLYANVADPFLADGGTNTLAITCTSVNRPDRLDRVYAGAYTSRPVLVAQVYDDGARDGIHVGVYIPGLGYGVKDLKYGGYVVTTQNGSVVNVQDIYDIVGYDFYVNGHAYHINAVVQSYGYQYGVEKNFTTNITLGGGPLSAPQSFTIVRH